MSDSEKKKLTDSDLENVSGGLAQTTAGFFCPVCMVTFPNLIELVNHVCPGAPAEGQKPQKGGVQA